MFQIGSFWGLPPDYRNLPELPTYRAEYVPTLDPATEQRIATLEARAAALEALQGEGR
jgi:hypothetical protein